MKQELTSQDIISLIDKLIKKGYKPEKWIHPLEKYMYIIEQEKARNWSLGKMDFGITSWYTGDFKQHSGYRIHIFYEDEEIFIEDNNNFYIENIPKINKTELHLKLEELINIYYNNIDIKEQEKKQSLINKVLKFIR